MGEVIHGDFKNRTAEPNPRRLKLQKSEAVTPLPGAIVHAVSSVLESLEAINQCTLEAASGKISADTIRDMNAKAMQEEAALAGFSEADRAGVYTIADTYLETEAPNAIPPHSA